MIQLKAKYKYNKVFYTPIKLHYLTKKMNKERIEGSKEGKETTKSSIFKSDEWFNLAICLMIIYIWERKFFKKLENWMP